MEKNGASFGTKRQMWRPQQMSRICWKSIECAACANALLYISNFAIGQEKKQQKIRNFALCFIIIIMFHSHTHTDTHTDAATLLQILTFSVD